MTLLIALQPMRSGKDRLSQDVHVKTGLRFSNVTSVELLWCLCLPGCPGASVQSRAALLLVAVLWVGLSFWPLPAIHSSACGAFQLGTSLPVHLAWQSFPVTSSDLADWLYSSTSLWMSLSYHSVFSVPCEQS